VHRYVTCTHCHRLLRRSRVVDTAVCAGLLRQFTSFPLLKRVALVMLVPMLPEHRLKHETVASDGAAVALCRCSA
jgi:hypothetical protein